jgi:hypothetical protein
MSRRIENLLIAALLAAGIVLAVLGYRAAGM